MDFVLVDIDIVEGAFGTRVVSVQIMHRTLITRYGQEIHYEINLQIHKIKENNRDSIEAGHHAVKNTRFTRLNGTKYQDSKMF